MCVCSVFYAFVVFVHGARVHIFFPTPHAELVNFNPPDKGGGGTRHRPLPLRQYDNYIKLNTGNGREHSPTPEPSIAL